MAGFELLWGLAPKRLHGCLLLMGPCSRGPLGFSLVSFMDNAALMVWFCHVSITIILNNNFVPFNSFHITLKTSELTVYLNCANRWSTRHNCSVSTRVDLSIQTVSRRLRISSATSLSKQTLPVNESQFNEACLQSPPSIYFLKTKHYCGFHFLVKLNYITTQFYRPGYVRATCV